MITLPESGFTIEGRGQVCLSTADYHYFYPVFVQNTKSGEVTGKDYRAPKAVNPDYNLNQQSIKHNFDQGRNLTALSGADLFHEEVLSHKPMAGVYQVIESNPLSSYYIQPGTSREIPLQGSYDHQSNCFNVIAGPLFDSYGNKAADGTMVAFTYSIGNKTFRKESALFDGIARISIPANVDTIRGLYARAFDTFSEKIKISK
jgi:hypothetical protein